MKIYYFKPLVIDGEKTKYRINQKGDIKDDTGNVVPKHISGDNYYKVNIQMKTKRRTMTVHRLVALTFIPNPENKTEVHHIDGESLNNDSDNLLWCTISEHWEHERSKGFFKRARGESHGNNKYKKDMLLCVLTDIKNGMSRIEASNKYGVEYSVVCKICVGDAWVCLNDDMELPVFEKVIRDEYSIVFKQQITQLLLEGKNPKQIAMILNIDYTEKIRNYIKTFKRRYINDKVQRLSHGGEIPQ